MPGTFVVNFTDPTTTPITVPPLTVDETTSIRMAGYRYPVYGEMIWENFLHLAENFANSLPPNNPITGQLWVDTTVSTQPCVKVYNSVTTTWESISQEISIGSTPPAYTNGVWLNPVANGLYYWNGVTWVNILCFVISNTADYNEVVVDINTILAKYGQPLLASQPTASISNWNALFAKVRQLAEYRRLPDHIVNRLTTVSTLSWCSDSTVSMFSVMKKFDTVLRALDQIASSENIDPSCIESLTPLTASKTRNTAWQSLTHNITFSHGTSANVDVFFQTGGTYSWFADVVGSGLTPIAAEWQSLLNEVGVVSLAWSAMTINGSKVGPGIKDLISTPIVLWTRATLIPGYYHPGYYAPTTTALPTIRISGYRNLDSITLTVELSGPDVVTSGTFDSVFGVTRVGAPCLDVAPTWPSVVYSTLT